MSTASAKFKTSQLIDWSGSFQSVDGSRPAHARAADLNHYFVSDDAAREEASIVPGVDLRTALRSMTYEQVCIVSSLVAARSRAATALIHVTSRMREAALAGDRHAFSLAQAESREALKKCEACKLALEVTVATFFDTCERR